MITKINHVGIAVASIDAHIKFYTETLGLELKDIEIVEDQKVRTAIIAIGESRLELLEATDPESAIAKHIENRGEGLHHLAFEVDDVTAAIADLKGKEVRLIDETPRGGVENSTIAFLHPKGPKVLLEIVQPADAG
jgi:methylmalonyl-CoA epimerase